MPYIEASEYTNCKKLGTNDLRDIKVHLSHQGISQENNDTKL